MNLLVKSCLSFFLLVSQHLCNSQNVCPDCSVNRVQTTDEDEALLFGFGLFV